MDARRFGATLRAVRLRRRLRQVDVARLVGVSDATVSRIERGHLDRVTVGTLVAVGRSLEVSIDLRAWSRAGDLDRLVNARHAALAVDVLRALHERGWVARPEVSFNERGERGFVDILAWQERRTALLVIELKTEIVDVGELLGVLDRKRRLAARIAAGVGWRVPTARQVSIAVVVGESATSRRRVHAHAHLIRAALPQDGRQLRGYLRDPRQPVAALAFWPYRHDGTTGRGWSAVRRVSRAPRPPGHARPAAATSSLRPSDGDRPRPSVLR